MEWTPATIAAVAAGVSSLLTAVLTVLLVKGGPLVMRLLNWTTKNKQVQAKMAAEGYEKFIERLVDDVDELKAELKATRELHAVEISKVRTDHHNCQLEQAALRAKVDRLEQLHSITVELFGEVLSADSDQINLRIDASLGNAAELGLAGSLMIPTRRAVLVYGKPDKVCLPIEIAKSLRPGPRD